MSDDRKRFSVDWYRTPLEGDVLRRLNRRSDARGALQTVSFLGLLVLTGAAGMWSLGRLPLAATVGIVFVHGTLHAFLLNGFHELVHGTVFKSKWLNAAFLRIFSFLSWNSHVLFKASHTRHHQFTLHPPHDLEVVLPRILTLRDFLLRSFVNPLGFFETLRNTARTAYGGLHGEWQQALFPDSDPAHRRKLFNWARCLLAGHALLIGFSFYFGLWLLPVLTSFASFYGGWLLYFCNHTQHIGLQDNVPDFRLCCRTFEVNPVVRYLYWHMNYHTEHHMYAAMPCYNLRRLHRIIRHDLPPVHRGLVPMWKQIVGILKKQKVDPTYQYEAPLPPGGASRGPS